LTAPHGKEDDLAMAQIPWSEIKERHPVIAQQIEDKNSVPDIYIGDPTDSADDLPEPDSPAAKEFFDAARDMIEELEPEPAAEATPAVADAHG
jgi:hypothetical protein